MFLSEQVLADQCALHVSRLELLSLIIYIIGKQPNIFILADDSGFRLGFFCSFVQLPSLNFRQVLHQLLNPFEP